MKTCTRCGSSWPDETEYCAHDGEQLPVDDAVDPFIGSVIAKRYRIQRKLGEGGMGAVYLGEHIRMERKSAIKVLSSYLVHDSDALSRFTREAANAAKISHPNVCTIYDFGEAEDGLFYLAMEYIEGVALSAELEAHGPLPPDRAVAIVNQAANGLQAAHSLGIVHRDLKPDNIMISRDSSGSERVKVVDFGIAKAFGHKSDHLQKVTRTGLLVGTPEYMSPEQFSGDLVDFRSDIYSLALVLFRSLTGTLPFQADSVHQVMAQRLTGEPRKLGDVTPRLSGLVPLQEVISKALHRDPKGRHGSAREFSEALEQAVRTTTSATHRFASNGADQRLDSGPPQLMELQQASEEPVPPALSRALTGKFELERAIGRGGAATVYAARRTEDGDRVAIKVLHAELSGALGTERFLREIHLSTKLRHPRILPQYESGQAGGHLYYVMPLVTGESLRERMSRERQMALDEALSIIGQVGEALSFAHSQGVIHRDVKPENILLAEHGAVVADFGLARAITSAGGGRLTESGIAMGTPAYMSPEQATNPHEADARSDVYALGCVLFEMLAGHAPYQGPSPQAVMARHAVDPVPYIRSVRSSVPVHVEHAVRKALDKVPADRCATVDEFLSAVTRPEGARARRRRMLGRPWVRRLAAASLVPLVGVVALVSRDFLRSETGPGVSEVTGVGLAVLPFGYRGPPDNEYIADGITAELTTQFSGVPGLRVIARRSAETYRARDKSVEQIALELGVEYLLDGSVFWDSVSGRVRVSPELIRADDGTTVWGQLYNEQMSQAFRVQAAIIQSVIRKLGIEQGEFTSARQATESGEAYDFYMRGISYFERQNTSTELRSAVDMFERAIAFDATFALAFARLAESRMRLYVWRTGDDADLAAATAAAENALTLEPSLAEAHLAQGFVFYWGHRNFDAAIEEFELALAAQPSNPAILQALGAVRRREGEFEEALTNLRAASALDPTNWRLPFDAGQTAIYLRRFEDAELLFDRALEIAPDVTLLYAYKASARWSGTADVDAVREVVEQAASATSRTEALATLASYGVMVDVPGYDREISRLSIDAFSGDSVNYFVVGGNSLGMLGNASAERAYYDSARVVLERRVRERGGPMPRSQLGRVYALLGMDSLAVAYGTEAVETLPISKDAFSGPVFEAFLAEILVRIGQPQAALRRLRTLLSIPSHLSVSALENSKLWLPLRGNSEFEQLMRDFR